MLNRLVTCLILSCFALAGCAVQSNVSRFDQPGKTYVITSTLTGRVAPAQSVTLVFKGEGKCKGAQIVGNKTRIVAQTHNAIFDNCTFRGTFCNSTLVATNFGCSDNMEKKAFKWSFGDGPGKTTANTYKYVPSNSVNNKKALDMIAQFCSGSTDVSIEFNGKFYTPVADYDGTRGTNVMTIRNASGLRLSGGTLVQGLVFFNSEDVTIKSMSFVGQHTVHDFPIVYASESDNFAKIDARLSTKNCYNIVANQFAACGLAPEGIFIKVDQGGESRNFLIEDCNFEMRANGVITGSKGRTSNVHHITVMNCKFSHIYFQPVGFHGSYNVVDGIEAEYAMQGFDLSSGTNNSVVRNSSFKSCALGPKQETIVTKAHGHYDNYANRAENCYYQINEKFRTIGIKRQIFYASEGKPGDTFQMTNMTFDVDVTSPIEGIECRAYGLKITNLKLNLNLRGGHTMSFLFSPNGASAYVPNIVIDGANIVCNASLDAFAKSATAKLNMQINNLVLQGNGKIEDVAFRGLNTLSVSNSQFLLPSNYFTQLTPNVTIIGSNVNDVKRIAFYPSNKGAENYTFDVRNSRINAGTAVFWAANCNKFVLKASGNTLRTGTVLTFDKNVSQSDINVTGNDIEVRGQAAFKGIRNAPTSRSVSKIETNTIKLPRSAVVFDAQSSTFKASIVAARNSIR